MQNEQPSGNCEPIGKSIPSSPLQLSDADRRRVDELRKKREEMFLRQTKINKARQILRDADILDSIHVQKAIGDHEFKSASQQWCDTLARVRRVIANRGMVLLIGPRGTGKTQMMLQILIDHAMKGMDIYYDRSNTLAWKSMSKNTAIYKSALDIVTLAATVPVLAIDEINKWPKSEHPTIVLETIVDARYSKNLPLLMAGNLTKESVVDYLGSGICRRISEYGGIIDTTWTDCDLMAQVQRVYDDGNEQSGA